MSTIQIRIDETIKKNAQKVLEKIGLDMSSAIKLYLKQIALRKGVPFLILTENGLTPKEEQLILDAAKEARQGKNISPAMNVPDAIKRLRAL